MLEELIEIASEYTQETLNEDSKLRSDLGLTSFDLVSLISDIEDKYNIKIDDNDIKDIITVKDLINYINSKN